eukprot:SAG11_NODE_882_length_6739_cov_1.990211_1_plen_103_part_10
MHLADVCLLLEYPSGVNDTPDANMHAAVVQTKDVLLKLAWDYDAMVYTMDLNLGHLAISKTDAECRTDPTLSCSEVFCVQYRASLNPADMIRAGHAYELSVSI